MVKPVKEDGSPLAEMTEEVPVELLSGILAAVELVYVPLFPPGFTLELRLALLPKQMEESDKTAEELICRKLTVVAPDSELQFVLEVLVMTTV